MVCVCGNGNHTHSRRHTGRLYNQFEGRSETRSGELSGEAAAAASKRKRRRGRVRENHYRRATETTGTGFLTLWIEWQITIVLSYFIPTLIQLETHYCKTHFQNYQPHTFSSFSLRTSYEDNKKQTFKYTDTLITPH